MPPKREKPPKETRAEALNSLMPLLDQLHPKTAVAVLLTYFTTADLLGIIADLQKDFQSGVVASSTIG